MESQSGTMLTKLTGLIILVSLQASSSHWMSSGTLRPLNTVNYLSDLQHSDVASPVESLVTEFHGNSSHTDHFKLLKEDGTSVLVGARNIIYNLSLPDLQEYSDQRIHWSCSAGDKAACDLKGKGREDCQNYIRVLSAISASRLLVCGTNCYNPLCRHYLLDSSGHYQVEAEFSGKGYAPYDPRHNSTSLYTSGNLFAATVADFSGTDSLIIKNNLRTEQYDYKHLNAPDFVSSLEDEDHVYFFFRESAVEYMNCGKAVFSRVARVCKTDEGGSNRFRNRWTSFLKTRLNCSVPGDFPFYFDQIQSTTNFFPDPSDNQIFYGVFTTPPNSILGSAVCRFSLSDLDRSFEGNFKTQERVDSNWLSLSPSQVPSPRPGRCYNQSSRLPEPSLHFIKNNCLMDQPVVSQPNSPIFVKFGDGELLTKIAVQRGVMGRTGERYDVLFIGTNRGKVIKSVVSSDRPSMETSFVEEEIQIFSETVPVLNLLIVEPPESASRLIILSADNVRSIPLDSCLSKDSCESCLLGISCAWELGEEGGEGRCVRHSQVEERGRLVLSSQECPVRVETTPEPTTIVHDIEDETTTEMVTADDDIDIAEDPTVTSLSRTTPPAPQLSSAPSTASCPPCQCFCPTSPPLPLPVLQSTPGPGAANKSNGSGGGDDDVDNELDYGWQEKEDSLQQDSQNEKLRSQVKTEPDGVRSSKSDSEDQTLPLTMAVTIALLTGLASAVLGFLSGFFLSRLCSHKSSASVTSSNVSLVKPCPLDKPVNADSGYTTPTNCDNNNSSKNVNILMNGNQSKPASANSKLERTKLSCTGTLQKVKRVYL